MEEKEAVINRTNHANARRCAAQWGWKGNGVERGWGMAMLGSDSFDGVSTLLFLFSLSL